MIPPGTAAAELRGEPVVAIPPEIRLEVGQAIVIRNDDRAMHYFFEEPIAPGQMLERRYDRPGRYRYTGVRSCSVGGVTGLLVEVVPIGGGQ